MFNETKLTENHFDVLSQVELPTEKRGKYTYISWAHSWAALAQADDKASWRIVEHIKADGTKSVLHPAGKGYLVRTEVTTFGLTLPMHLPVMDIRTNAIANPDARDVNDAIMRCLTKNIALFGLGLYPYQKEDLPKKPSAKQNPVQKRMLSATERTRINEVAMPLAEGGYRDQVVEIYKKYGLSGGIPKEDLDVNEVIKELKSLEG